MRTKKPFMSKKIIMHHPDEHFQIGYKDIIRCIEAGDAKRFYQLAINVDLNALQEGNKPFIFHAIERNELDLVEALLDREIDLENSYELNVNTENNEEEILKYITPLEYSKHMKKREISNMIEDKLNGQSLEDRWLKVVETSSIDQIDEFRMKFKHWPDNSHFLSIGLIKAAEIGSNRLIDHFLNLKDVDINYLYKINNILVSPLLRSIEYHRNETSKYLIFRKANINLSGEYGDALVTAIYFENSNDMITLLLEKGASLASRHNHWPNLNLREYCIQMNKIQSKLAIDNFVFKLIANGEYNKLKSLTDNGYVNINVTNRFKKTGRDLAVERSHLNIVQLIDKIEEKQRRLRTKMNY